MSEATLAASLQRISTEYVPVLDLRPWKVYEKGRRLRGSVHMHEDAFIAGEATAHISW